ncbi:hypothetical protein RCL1_000302 [Eukaryota sp. TZLM3-RCL]
MFLRSLIFACLLLSVFGQSVTRINAESLPKFLGKTQFALIMVAKDDNNELVTKSFAGLKEAAQQLPSVSFAFSSDNSEQFLANFGVPELPEHPLLFLYRSGFIRPYLGPRDSKGIVGTLSQLKNAIPHHLTTKQQKKRFQSLTNARLLGYFDSLDSEQARVYAVVAGFYTNLPFYVITDKVLARSLRFKSINTVQMWKGDENPIDFEEEYKVSELLRFADANRRQLLEPLHPESFSSIISSGHPVVFMFYQPGDNGFLTLSREVAKQMESVLIEEHGEKKVVELSFWSVDVNQFSDFVQKFGLSNIPSVAVLDLASQKQGVYPSDGAITVADVSSWIKDFLEGKAKQTIKSEEIPSENPGPVFKLVTHSFPQMVLHDNRVVIVKAYTDWCGFCTKLKPIYEEIAEELAELQNDKYVLTEVDMDKNILPNFEVKSLPTLLKYRPGMKNTPEVYDGVRDKDNIMKWILS